MKIGAVGRNKIRSIKNKIEDSINKEGLSLPNELVPMEKIIEYFKINVEFLVSINNSKNRNL